MSDDKEIKTIARLFLKLGLTAFGGPAAHIAMMRKEVVIERKWMTDQHFLDLIGATNLIPGPNSTEIAIHIGKERGGWKGFFVAGLCFILPAVLITGIFAWLYKNYGQLPALQPFIYGIKPAIIAIILSAIFPLAKKSLKSMELVWIGIAVLILSFLNFNEIYLMFGAGFFSMALYSIRANKRNNLNSLLPVTILKISGPTFITGNWNLFLIFLKIGAILYGSGYVLFAFLDAELVSTGILTRLQLIDAIAVGQITPGPVFSSVTFVGYQINGISGAVISTIAIFLPAFIFVALLNPIVKKMRNSNMFSAFLDAVNISSVAIIISVCYLMGKESLHSWQSVLIGLISLAVTFGIPRINTVFIIIGSSILGYFLTMV